MDRHHGRHTSGARVQPYGRPTSQPPLLQTNGQPTGSSSSSSSQGGQAASTHRGPQHRGGSSGSANRAGECDPEPLRAGQAAPLETDPHRLAQRQKQLDMGYATVEYHNYAKAVPRKRSWDGQVKKWRRLLHAWDSGGAHSSEMPATQRAVAAAAELEAPPPLERADGAMTQQQSVRQALLPTPVFAPSAPAASAPSRTAHSAATASPAAAAASKPTAFQFTDTHRLAAGTNWADVTDDEPTQAVPLLSAARAAAAAPAPVPAVLSLPPHAVPSLPPSSAFAVKEEDHLSSLLDDAEADVDRALATDTSTARVPSDQLGPDTDELLDYEEDDDDADAEMRAAALAAAQELL